MDCLLRAAAISSSCKERLCLKDNRFLIFICIGLFICLCMGNCLFTFICKSLFQQLALTGLLGFIPFPCSLLTLYFVLVPGSQEELVQHALQALRECLPSDSELTSKVSHTHARAHMHTQ